MQKPRKEKLPLLMLLESKINAAMAVAESEKTKVTLTVDVTDLINIYASVKACNNYTDEFLAISDVFDYAVAKRKERMAKKRGGTSEGSCKDPSVQA